MPKGTAWLVHLPKGTQLTIELGCEILTLEPEFLAIEHPMLGLAIKPQDWKRSVFIPIPKKDNAKECSNYLTIALISHASKLMLKILQARLQHYVICELPDVQAGFRKGRRTRDQIANIRWVIEKATEFHKKHLLY